MDRYFCGVRVPAPTTRCGYSIAVVLHALDASHLCLSMMVSFLHQIHSILLLLSTASSCCIIAACRLLFDTLCLRLPMLSFSYQMHPILLSLCPAVFQLPTACYLPQEGACVVCGLVVWDVPSYWISWDRNVICCKLTTYDEVGLFGIKSVVVRSALLSSYY